MTTPYDPGPLFDALHSKLAAMGIGNAEIGEPTDPPTGLYGAVMWAGAAVTQIHGTLASGEVRFNIRFYSQAIQQPSAEMEKTIARVTLDIMNDLGSDFDLGDAQVRNVEVIDLEARGGFQSIGEGPRIMYRISDLIVNVLVNDMISLVN